MLVTPSRTPVTKDINWLARRIVLVGIMECGAAFLQLVIRKVSKLFLICFSSDLLLLLYIIIIIQSCPLGGAYNSKWSRSGTVFQYTEDLDLVQIY